MYLTTAGVKLRNDEPLPVIEHSVHEREPAVCSDWLRMPYQQYTSHHPGPVLE